MDAAIVSVLSELDNVTSLKEEKRTTLKAFLDEKLLLFFFRLAMVRVMNVTDRTFVKSPSNLFFF